MDRQSPHLQWVLIAAFATVVVPFSGQFARSASPNGAESPSSPPPADGPCGCADLNALFDREAEVRSAIAALKAESDALQGEHIGETTWSQKYNPSQDLHLLVADIQKAMEEAHDRAISDQIKNMTFPSNCSRTARASTPCLQAVVDVGESAYIQWCTTLRGLSGGSHDAWQSQMELAQMLDEALVAYGAELTYILETIDRLRPLCNVKGWSGNVTVTYAEKVNQTTPWPGTGMHGSITVDNDDTREATIWVFDGKAIGSLIDTIADTKTSQASGEEICGKYKKGTRTVDETETVVKHGTFNKRASLHISMDHRGAYVVEGFVNGGYGVGSTFKRDDGRDPCDSRPPPTNIRGPLGNQILDGIRFAGHGKADPNALTLDDSDMPLDQQVVLGSMTRTLKIEWHLTRSR